MKTHSLRVHPSSAPLAETDQLAWKLAAVAADPVPLEADVAEAVADRLIDGFGVALAALGHHTVSVAMDQARAHPRKGGAVLIGAEPNVRASCEWAAWANATAIRELDLHDNYYGANVNHPADTIAPVLAVAQQCGAGGPALQRGIAAAYEIAIRLADGVALTEHRIDHVAHYGPAVVCGIGAMLGLPVRTVCEAVNHAAHVSVSTTQARRGRITGWKANAPAHVGKVAVEAVDRAMRGEEGPKPVFEGEFGWLAVLLGGGEAEVKLPEPGEPWRSLLESYTKAHATGYHAQAFIDIAFRLRDRIADIEAVERVDIFTKAYTHNYVGSGAGDPEKMSPDASRETLDHSVMFVFAAALFDGEFHHERTFARERIRRPQLVRLWQKVRTVADEGWTRRFRDRESLQKDHGGSVVVTFRDGTTIQDEIAVPDSHPRGAHPFGRADYVRKFAMLTEGVVSDGERQRLLDELGRLGGMDAAAVHRLHVRADLVAAPATRSRGLFDAEPPL